MTCTGEEFIQPKILKRNAIYLLAGICQICNVIYALERNKMFYVNQWKVLENQGWLDSSFLFQIYQICNFWSDKKEICLEKKFSWLRRSCHPDIWSAWGPVLDTYMSKMSADLRRTSVDGAWHVSNFSRFFKQHSISNLENYIKKMHSSRSSTSPSILERPSNRAANLRATHVAARYLNPLCKSTSMING